MIYRFYFRILLFLLAFPSGILLSTERSVILYQEANRQYHQFQSKRNFVPEEKWLQLVRDFEHIQRNFPSSTQASFSLFRIGNLYRQLFRTTRRDIYLNRSLRTFRQLINDHPKTSLVDDSQYIIGNIFEEDKKEINLALLEYNKVLKYNGDQKNKTLKNLNI